MKQPEGKKPIVEDAELTRLVAELNRGRQDAPLDPEEPAASGARQRLSELLLHAAKRGATDLLLVAGSPPVIRIAGALERVGSDPLGEEEVDQMFRGILPGPMRTAFDGGEPVDLALNVPLEGKPPLRFRLNLHRQRGTVAASLRSIGNRVPTLQELNLPPEIASIVDAARGLVLVCGPTGSGKTSTLAALIGEINKRRPHHIVTIEDPIEYEHRHESSLVEQIEVGRDAPSFGSALRAALRQDPDVILIGEIRDAETAATALSAAETGHLILATLHTADSVQSIHRLVDIFPPARHAQIHQQLSFCLHAVLCQQLVPTVEGLFPVVELLLATDAVRNQIRTGKLQNLYNELVLGQRAGMISFEKSLARLVRLGKLSAEEARRRATRPDELDSLLRGA